MALSSVLTLTDLSDFLSPSQACIRPVETIDEQPVELAAPLTQIQVDRSGTYYEAPAPQLSQLTVAPRKKLETAKINLNDCLACSGCITSAESVLITLQSNSEVLSVLTNNPPASSASHRTTVLSVSPQSLASFAASMSQRCHESIGKKQILARIKQFAKKSLGFDYVFDTTFARHMSLMEQGHEFRERKESSNSAESQLPMVASACPGWICYAEKTHPEMLPFISRTKSPQQIMGTLVKSWLAKRRNLTAADVYHVTVMPCYDKKLEASRSDFYNDIYATRDVDCVITTGELETLMEEQKFDLTRWVSNQSNDDGEPLLPELIGHSGTSSGSYLHSVLAGCARNAGLSSLTLETKTVRSDHEEFILKHINTGEIIFKGAKCYGFRNLQNLVRKIGREGVQNSKRALQRADVHQQNTPTQQSNRRYDFIEMMACPSGCINGGGQLSRQPFPSKAAAEMVQPSLNREKRLGEKTWVDEMESVYWEDDGTEFVDFSLANHTDHGGGGTRSADELADAIKTELLRNGAGENLLRTSYRRVESDVGLAVQW